MFQKFCNAAPFSWWSRERLFSSLFVLDCVRARSRMWITPHHMILTGAALKGGESGMYAQVTVSAVKIGLRSRSGSSSRLPWTQVGLLFFKMWRYIVTVHNPWINWESFTLSVVGATRKQEYSAIHALYYSTSQCLRAPYCGPGPIPCRLKRV